MNGSSTPLTPKARALLVLAVRNEELCQWWASASVVDRLAYLAEHDQPTPWHRASGTTATVAYTTHRTERT